MFPVYIYTRREAVSLASATRLFQGAQVFDQVGELIARESRSKTRRHHAGARMLLLLYISPIDLACRAGDVA